MAYSPEGGPGTRRGQPVTEAMSSNQLGIATINVGNTSPLALHDGLFRQLCERVMDGDDNVGHYFRGMAVMEAIEIGKRGLRNVRLRSYLPEMQQRLGKYLETEHGVPDATAHRLWGHWSVLFEAQVGPVKERPPLEALTDALRIEDSATALVRASGAVAHEVQTLYAKPVMQRDMQPHASMVDLLDRAIEGHQHDAEMAISLRGILDVLSAAEVVE